MDASGGKEKERAQTCSCSGKSSMPKYWERLLGSKNNIRSISCCTESYDGSPTSSVGSTPTAPTAWGWVFSYSFLPPSCFSTSTFTLLLNCIIFCKIVFPYLLRFTLPL